MTKVSKFAWSTQPIAPSMGVRECYSRLSDALATLQREVSLFLLLDVMQLTVNIVAFLAFIIVKGLHRNRSLTFLVIFLDAVIRIVVLTFSCGQVTEEVNACFKIKIFLNNSFSNSGGKCCRSCVLRHQPCNGRGNKRGSEN